MWHVRMASYIDRDTACSRPSCCHHCSSTRLPDSSLVTTRTRSKSLSVRWAYVIVIGVGSFCVRCTRTARYRCATSRLSLNETLNDDVFTTMTSRALAYTFAATTSLSPRRVPNPVVTRRKFESDSTHDMNVCCHKLRLSTKHSVSVAKARTSSCRNGDRCRQIKKTTSRGTSWTERTDMCVCVWTQYI